MKTYEVTLQLCSIEFGKLLIFSMNDAFEMFLVIGICMYVILDSSLVCTLVQSKEKLTYGREMCKPFS